MMIMMMNRITRMDGLFPLAYGLGLRLKRRDAGCIARREYIYAFEISDLKAMMALVRADDGST
jgi:hypothetical protein